MWGLLAQRSRIRRRRYVGRRGIKRWRAGVESTWAAGKRQMWIRRAAVNTLTRREGDLYQEINDDDDDSNSYSPHLVEEGWGRSIRVEVRQGTSR